MGTNKGGGERKEKEREGEIVKKTESESYIRILSVAPLSDAGCG